ncbi:MAG: DUF411 domain-containing protein, partial [Aquabacterium sp.]
MPHPSSRRRTLVQALGVAALTPWLAPVIAANPRTAVEIWKSAECGCCQGWMTHLEGNGFVASAIHNEGNESARRLLGMPPALGSCHTARVGGYAIEGHVPAREIRRLLKERPAAVGLAVAGMPLGSPGMDGPDFDHRTQPYDVLL